MAGIVVEYARFVEVRQRRARIAEELIHPTPRAAVDILEPVSVHEDAIALRAPGTDTAINREGVDGRCKRRTLFPW